jgi:hypothetical protein
MKRTVSAVAALAFALSAGAAFADNHAKTAELENGTKVEIVGEAVSVINADGSKVPAPDGAHKLKDGTTVTTKGGKIVK